MNVKIKRQIQHLWFIEELLQKILTIEERCFSWKTSQPGICRIGVEKFYRSYSQPPSSDRTFCRNSCEMWSENRWRYIYKIIHIKSNCQDVYSSMLIFQSQGYCSEVLSVWNYSQEIITKTSVLEHLCSASLYPINFEKTSHISRKWKTDWSCECLVRMQS